MAIPQVTCGPSVEDEVSGNLPLLVNLSLTATGSPDQYLWTMLDVPPGSSANVGANGDFFNGVSTEKNPSYTADVGDGTYVVQGQAHNSEGWSDPVADGAVGQQNMTFESDDLGTRKPGEDQIGWKDILNHTIDVIETAITSGGGGDQVAVSGTDTTPGFLNDKLAAADGISATITDPAGDEGIQLSPTYGAVVNTVAQGNDGRFPTTDEKAALDGTGTPGAGNKFVTNDDARLPTTDEKNALDGTGTPSSSNKFVTNDDTRLPTTNEKDALAGTGTPASGNPYVNSDDARLAADAMPTSLTGEAGKVLSVKGAEDGYEHVERGSWSPGSTIIAADGFPSSSSSTFTGTSWAEIGLGLVWTFDVTYAGYYDLFLKSPVASGLTTGGSDAFVGLLIDKGNYGGFESQQMESKFHNVGERGSRSNGVIYLGRAYLGAGTHESRAIWKWPGSGNGLSVDSSVSYFHAWAVLSTGSGLGGENVDTQINPNDEAVTAGVTKIINTHTIIALDETVLLSFSCAYNHATTNTLAFQYRVDGGSWVSFAEHAEYGGYGSGQSASVAIPLLVGERTIDVGVLCGAAATIKGATEWPSESSIWQFRGGRFPVYDANDMSAPVSDKFERMIFDCAGISEVTSASGGKDLHVRLNGSFAPGQFIQVADSAPPASDISLLGSYTRFMPDAATSIPFSVEAAGAYELTIDYAVVIGAASSSIQTKVEIDEGDPSSITVGDNVDWIWRNTLNNGYSYPRHTAQVTLTRGAHTLKAYSKILSGSGVLIPGTSDRPIAKVTLRSVVGSGLGGVLADKDALAADKVITAIGPTFETTGLSATVTTHEGEWVDVRFEGTIGKSTLGNTWFGVKIDGGTLEWDGKTNTSYFPLYVFNAGMTLICNTGFKHQFSEGTHTVELFAAAQSTRPTTIRKESTLTLTQYHGGQFPVYDAGDLATPIADKFGRVVIGEGLQANATGDSLNISATGSAEGVDGDIATQTAPQVISTDSPSAVDVGGLTKTVDVIKGERIFVNVRGSSQHSGAGIAYVFISIDGVETQVVQVEEATSGQWRNLCAPFMSPAATATGSVVVKVRAAKAAAQSAWTFQNGVMDVAVLKGGYVEPENVPRLEFNTSTVVNAVAAPGASARGRLLLNNGIRYHAALPLSANLATTGLGGLDTGSVAISTMYRVYAVPSATAGLFELVASVTSPDGGGPTGYPIWRYLGSVYNKASGGIRQFKALSNGRVEFPDPTETALTIYEGGGGATPTQDTWYSLETGSAAGSGGTQIQRPLSDTVPISEADAFDVSAGVDADASPDTFRLFIESGQVLYTPSSVLHSGESFVQGEHDNRQVARGWIAIHDEDAYYRWDNVDGPFDWTVIVRGYQDKYLAGQEVQLQAEYTPDTKQPKGVWQSSTEVDFSARPGQLSVVQRTLSDGKVRTFTGTLNWDSANGVADLGFDETASQTGDAMIYFYLVPDTGNDDLLTIVASDNPPATGPTGRSIHELVWVTYRDTGSLINAVQSGNRFKWGARRLIAALTATGGVTAQSLSAIVPQSCSELLGHANLMTTGWNSVGIFADDGAGTAESVETIRYNADAGSQTETTSFEIPTPGSTKQFWHQHQGSGAASTHNVYANGWVDEWIQA